MKGKPKHLNSKEDYLYAREHYEESFWRPQFQALLDGRWCWYYVSDLESAEAGVTDDTHKVVEMTNSGESGETKYAQYELRENPTAKIFRIGFTVEEVEALMA